MEDLEEQQRDETYDEDRVKLIAEDGQCQQTLGNGVPDSFMETLEFDEP